MCVCVCVCVCVFVRVRVCVCVCVIRSEDNKRSISAQCFLYWNCCEILKHFGAVWCLNLALIDTREEEEEKKEKRQKEEDEGGTLSSERAYRSASTSFLGNLDHPLTVDKPVRSGCFQILGHIWWFHDLCFILISPIWLTVSGVKCQESVKNVCGTGGVGVRACRTKPDWNSGSQIDSQQQWIYENVWDRF